VNSASERWNENRTAAPVFTILCPCDGWWQRITSPAAAIASDVACQVMLKIACQQGTAKRRPAMQNDYWQHNPGRAPRPAAADQGSLPR
jgi:hypothetical protein